MKRHIRNDAALIEKGCYTSYGMWGKLGPISTICPLNCDFCYRKGNDSNGILNQKRYHKTVCDVEKLLDYLKSGIAIESTGDNGEIMCNPQLIPIIKRFRDYYPLEIISFTTSGIGLTYKKINTLNKHAPITLQISLNSADHKIRKKVMGDMNPKVAIESIRYFREFGIPFTASIVAWPTIPNHDILKTIDYLNVYDPVLIKIHLPSHTRYFNGIHLIEYQERWMQLVNMINSVRNKIEIPITWEPFIPIVDPFIPVITGVVKNSPAYRCGLKANDIINEINNVKIYYREQARRLLIQRSNDIASAKLKILRDGKIHNINIIDDGSLLNDEYPYRPSKYPRVGKMYGLIIHQGIDLSSVIQIKNIIEKNNARHVIVMSSKAMGLSAKVMIEKIAKIMLPDVKVIVIMPENKYFGGNIIIGDLLTCSDYVIAIKDYMGNYGDIDLVIIPSTPFNDEKDVVGVHWKTIEKETNISIELLTVQRIYF